MAAARCYTAALLTYLYVQGILLYTLHHSPDLKELTNIHDLPYSYPHQDNSFCYGPNEDSRACAFHRCVSTEQRMHSSLYVVRQDMDENLLDECRSSLCLM